MKAKRIPGNPAGSKLWRKCPEKRLDDPAFLTLVEKTNTRKAREAWPIR